MSERVLVIGGGGREHALVEALRGASGSPTIEALPGNDGMPADVVRHRVDERDHAAVAEVAQGARLVVVGPEAPLVAGLADHLRAQGTSVFGPSARAARLEGSKAFAKAVMDRAGVPTARWKRCTSAVEAKAFAREIPGEGAVIKADGLAAGKGVVVASDLRAADAAIDDMFGGAHGAAGQTLVVEEELKGEELSLLAVTDGKALVHFPPAQDHKRLLDGDLGPNTGGMGAYAPAPVGQPDVVEAVLETCMKPVLRVLQEEDSPLVGVLYAGIMLTRDGPKVLEYNVRFGDPETQAILPLLDEDLLSLFIAATEGALRSRSVLSRNLAALTVVLASAGYPASPRKGDAIHGLEAAGARSNVTIVHAGTKQSEEGWHTHGGRVLGVTGTGKTLREASATAYAAADEIRFEGRQLRKDIGARALR